MFACVSVCVRVCVCAGRDGNQHHMGTPLDFVVRLWFCFLAFGSSFCVDVKVMAVTSANLGNCIIAKVLCNLCVNDAIVAFKKKEVTV